MKQLSPKAIMFRDHNQNVKIVEATWLDKNGKHPKGPPETWVQFRVKFTDATVMVLSDEDVADLLENEICPQWDVGELAQ